MTIDRRQFLHDVSALAAAGMASRLDAQSLMPSAPPPVKHVRTSVLDIGYHESGPASGVPVILLHGFPDDAHAYDGVAPKLAAAGHRTFAVYLRGYGPTSFLDPHAPRTAQQSAIGQDVIDFADALELDRIVVAGYDWGGRAAGVAAALHPDRVRAAVLIGGYSIQNTITMPPPAPAASVRRLWYQWYFNTEIGRAGLAKNRRELCELMWREWSPTWQFTPELYAQTAASFDNPDFVACVIHSYRHRNLNAPGEARFEATEKRLSQRPAIEVPVLVLHGGDDAFGRQSAAISAGERATLPRILDKGIVEGAGHFVPHETPEPVAQALIDVLSATR
jgi:pimeloyl-ACP methyl ester carboxylesterase